MSPSCHRIDVRHQAIAQLVVVNKRLIGRMMIRSNVPDFTKRPLTMSTEQRDEGTELVPTGLQLTPFFQVFVLDTTLVKQLLSCHVTILNAEATLIHSPERNTRHRIVKTCRHLSAHIFPTGTDIATPCCCRETLFTSETTTSQQEHARFIVLTLPYATLTIIDGISIHC